MAQAETIKEFLVALGFKVDEKGLKKFKDGVEGATVAVTKLVATIAGAALTVSAGVAAFAANMEALYFSVQKMGASAINVKSFEKAMANFGVSSGEALQSVQSLARFMRETPAAEGFLKSLGVQTRDANGNLKDTTDLMISLGSALQDKPYYLARQYGSMLGIGEDALRAMLNGDFAREVEKQRAMLKDSGYDEATKKAHEFGIRLRELQTRIEAIGVSLGLDALILIEKWSPSIESAIGLVKNLVDVMKTAGNWLMDFGFRATAGAFMMSRLATGDVKGAREAARAMVDGMDQSLKNGGESGASPAKPSAGTSVANPVGFFMGLGWTKEQASGIVANLQRESHMNPNAVGDSGKAYGIAQWHPDRQKNFANWAGKDIRESTLEEQMRFVNYELTDGAERKAGMLLRASQSAEMAGRVMSKYYERPLATDREASMRGADAVQIAQNTTINVNGGDAAATGRAVANEQDRVNQNLTRNLKLSYN